MHAVVAVGEGKLININILLFTTRSQQATTTITKQVLYHLGTDHGSTTGRGLKTIILIYCSPFLPLALSPLTMAMSGRMNLNREGFDLGTLRLKEEQDIVSNWSGLP